MNEPSNIFETLALQSRYEPYKQITEDEKQIENEGQKEEKNVFEYLSEEPVKDKFSFLETAKDIGQQVLAKGAQGFAGAYGNIAELLGQNKENLTPGMKARFQREFENPLASETDEFQDYARLPTSEDAKKFIENTTGIGEGKTPAGRIAGRGAEFIGESLAIPGSTGAKTLATLGGAGVAGQSARELGAPEGVATGLEIGGSIIPSLIQGRVVPRGAEAKELANAGRTLGLTEKQITPLIQSEKKLATLSKIAKKDEATKDLFASIKSSLGDSYDTVKKSVAKLGRLSTDNEDKLIKSFSDIRNDLSKTLQPSPDKEAAIKYIESAIDKIIKNGTSPEEIINTWQDVNKSVNWNSIQGGKKALSRLKEPMMEVLQDVAPQAAKDFDLTNKLYSKYSQISRKLKPDVLDAILNKGELFSTGPAAVSLVLGNPMPLVALGSGASVRILANEMLTNPYFQNISNKLVKNFNKGSLKATEETMREVYEYMQDKHPKEDWKFLVE
jgi:hypothetical protein